jgi:DAACS family dicarboxylate/amino acid:cation (Na+ or H+) symporter
MSSHRGILVAAAAGAALGIAANALGRNHPWLDFLLANVAAPVGQIFLRLLFMLVIPLLFSALVLGVAELDLADLGRMGARMLGYTVVVSAIAVALGIALVNLLGPGRGASAELLEAARHGATVKAAPAPGAADFAGFLAGLVPQNPVKAMADGDMLGVIVFSLVFGVGLAVTRSEGAERLRGAVEGLYDVSMTLVAGVLRLAPLGVGALLFAMTARLGGGLLRQLAAYVGVVLLGLGLHLFVVYSLSVKLFGGMSPRRFFRGSRVAILTAFSTASSNATLPTSLRVAEEDLGLPRRVARFVLTAGSAMNQNGTALFEGVTVLFLAQVYGVDMGVARQALVMGICVLAGVGTAGIPAGSIPVIAMILGLFGIPVEGLGLVLGVDRLLDMCRTTVNVTGDLAAAVYVAAGERADGIRHGEGA